MADIFVSDLMIARDKIENIDLLVRFADDRTQGLDRVLLYLRGISLGLCLTLPLEILINKKFIGNPHLSYIWLSIIVLLYIGRLFFWIWYMISAFDLQTRRREMAQVQENLAQFIHRTTASIAQKIASGNLADKNLPNVFSRVHAEKLNLQDEYPDEENFDQHFAEFKLALGGDTLWHRLYPELVHLELGASIEDDIRRALGKAEAEALLARVQQELTALAEAEAAKAAAEAAEAAG